MSWRIPAAAGLTLLLASCSPSTADRDAMPASRSPATAGARPAASQERQPTSPIARAATRPQVSKSGGTNPPASAPRAEAAEEGALADPPGPDDLVARAEIAGKGGDLEKAIRLLEQALKADPKHRRALFRLALVRNQRAIDLGRPGSSPYYLKTAEAMRKLRETYKELDAQERMMLSVSLYNEACTYAVENQQEKALDALKDALDTGLAQVELLAKDVELDSIRKSPRFATLMKQAERNARVAAEEKAGRLYNAACTHAVENQPEKALDALKDALDTGFAQVDRFVEDVELNSIRRSPRFASLMKQVERNARAAAGEKASRLADETTPFPFDFALPDLDGKTVTLDDVKGNITIVTFWGTWCAPCRREVPRYAGLLAKYRDQGLSIVGLAYERLADADVGPLLRSFVKEHEIPYKCLVGDDKTRQQVPGFEGYPTTLFLDRTGTVRVKAVGECSSLDLDAILALLLRPGERSSQE